MVYCARIATSGVTDAARRACARLELRIEAARHVLDSGDHLRWLLSRPAARDEHQMGRFIDIAANRHRVPLNIRELGQRQQQLRPVGAHLRRREVAGHADDGESLLRLLVLAERQLFADGVGRVGVGEELVGERLRDDGDERTRRPVVCREITSPQQPDAHRVEMARADATAILDGIVQQRADRLVLVAAVVQYQPGDDEQVRDVRDAGSLAQLIPVHVRRVQQCRFEPGCERHRLRGNECSTSSARPRGQWAGIGIAAGRRHPRTLRISSAQGDRCRIRRGA